MTSNKLILKFRSWNAEYIFLALVSVFLLSFLGWYAFTSPGCEGGMDSYNHYLISRYSWKHPELFLDQWGKPLYNIIASPFANLGFAWVKLLNIMLWIASAWMCWLTARKLGLHYAWIAFVLVLIPEESVKNTLSGLTEYLNGFLLIGFMYLAACHRWNAAAALAGLLPFARSEGFVIMAAVGFYLLFVEKKYLSLVWFLSGPVLFNILGWIIAGDPLWIIHNPYIKAQLQGPNICGSGSLFHYARESRFIFSLAGTVLLLAGTLFSFYHGMLRFRNKQFIDRNMFFLCALIFWLYFGVHSFIWWKGMMGSCGYSRVMIVITPLMAILGTYGINRIISSASKFRQGIMWLIILLMGISFSHTYLFVKGNMPYGISDEQKEYVRVARWLKATDYRNEMVYFLYPYLNILADIDPYDKRNFEFLWSFDFDFSPVGSILIWDAHFGPNECKIPLSKLLNNPDFILLKSFIPEKSFTTMDERPFEIHIFKRVKNSTGN